MDIDGTIPDRHVTRIATAVRCCSPNPGCAAGPRGAEEELSAKLPSGQDTPGGAAKAGAKRCAKHRRGWKWNASGMVFDEWFVYRL